MYVRGYFKAHQIPTALGGMIMLLLSLWAGWYFTAHASAYRRQILAVVPFLPRSTPAVDESPEGTSSLSIAYLLNSIVTSLAIFHAGVFPLYQSTSQIRYWNKLQDGLAAFGWLVLSLHHMANTWIIASLVGGVQLTAYITPLLLLLPASHFAMRLLPSAPPSTHFKLGLYVDLATHIPLALLYAWRAWAVGQPWELIGTAAELLHLGSVIPEAVLHKELPTTSDNKYSPSWENPRGSPSMEHYAAGIELQETTSEATSSREEGGADRGYARGQRGQQQKQAEQQPAGSYDSIGARVAARHSQPRRRSSRAQEAAEQAPQKRSRGHQQKADQPPSSAGYTTMVSDFASDDTPPLAAHAVCSPIGATPIYFPSWVDEPSSQTLEPFGVDEHGADPHAHTGAGTPAAAGRQRRSTQRELFPQLAKLPTYPMLILINALAFFCVGGLIAITSAPPSKITPSVDFGKVFSAASHATAAFPHAAVHAGQRAAAGVSHASHAVSDRTRAAEEQLLKAYQAAQAALQYNVLTAEMKVFEAAAAGLNTAAQVGNRAVDKIHGAAEHAHHHAAEVDHQAHSSHHTTTSPDTHPDVTIVPVPHPAAPVIVNLS